MPNPTPEPIEELKQQLHNERIRHAANLHYALGYIEAGNTTSDFLLKELEFLEQRLDAQPQADKEPS